MARRVGWILTLLLSACRTSAPPRASSDTTGASLPADSLVASTRDGVEIWFTLTRTDSASGGRHCQERGMEVRREGKRLPVPLLYTGETPVLINDSTLRARLWTNCQPGDFYLVDLTSGHPSREPKRRAQ